MTLAKDKIDELRAKMDEIKPVRSNAVPEADVTKVVKVIAETIGVSRPFELRELTETQRIKMLMDLGVPAPEAATSHKVGQMIASTMRKVKDTPVKYKGQEVCIISQPAPQGSNGPSRWALMPV